MGDHQVSIFSKAAPQQSTPRAPRPLPDEPYAGLLDVPDGAVITDRANRGLRTGAVARTAPHLLVAGGTGEGKSRTVLMPNVIRWAGKPVVSLSSKGDVAAATIRKRAQRGPVFLMDLSGEVPEDDLKGVPVTRVRPDPCAVIATDDEALRMADLLQEISSGSGGDAAFWKNLSRRRLACILRAAGYYPDPDTGKRVWGGGVAWAVDACEDPGPDEVPDPDDPGFDIDVPNWNSAYLRATLLGSRHAQSLMAAKRMDPKQRDSVGMNCQDALNMWADSVIAGAEHTAFTPEMLADGGATLFIVAPMNGAATPVAATLVSIVEFWRKRVPQIDAGELAPILFVLDEFTNGTRLPAARVNGWVGEGRGLGIRLILALQDSSQLEALWGQADAKVMRRIMPATLILPGANEEDILKSAAAAMLPEERVTASVDAGGRVSQSRSGFEMNYSQLLPREKGEGRLILKGMAGVKVRLPDISATDLLD